MRSLVADGSTAVVDGQTLYVRHFVSYLPVKLTLTLVLLHHSTFKSLGQQLSVMNVDPLALH